MRFEKCSFEGVWVIANAPHSDERGSFGRAYCRQQFADHGLTFVIDQISVSFNAKAGTVRGMHFQRSPHAEDKLVRCLQGAVHDVIVDLRKESPTFCQSFSVELSRDNNLSLFVPKGFAHGFQTLTDSAQLLYCIATPYSPDHASGVRWDDPAFDIKWPQQISSISQKDCDFEDFAP